MTDRRILSIEDFIAGVCKGERDFSNVDINGKEKVVGEKRWEDLRAYMTKQESTLETFPVILTGSRIANIRTPITTLVYLPYVSAEGVVIEDCNLYKANFGHGNFKGAKFDQVEAKQSDFSNTDLTGAEFEGESIFNGSSFVGATLISAQIWYGGTKYFNWADFTKADLTGAEINAVLGEAKLRDSNLKQTDLKQSFLGEADLTGALLDETHLEEVQLYSRDSHASDLIINSVKGLNMAKIISLYGSNATPDCFKIAGAEIRLRRTTETYPYLFVKDLPTPE